MRKITLSLGSFVLGALFMFVLGNHTSTRLQSVLAQGPAVPGVRAPNAVPVVPAVFLLDVRSSSFGPGAAIDLDGIDCKDCVLGEGVTIRYSGGSYRFENLRHSGVLTFQLNGAARNTATLLQSFGLIGCHAAPKHEPINPNNPTLKTANFRTETINSLASPVGIK